MAAPLPTSTPDHRRQAYRLGSQFLLANARQLAERIDRNLVSALVLLTVIRANTAAIRQSTEAGAYAAVRDIPPDHVRTPISVYAVARSLGLPYETVRRHVRRLKTSGRCVEVKGGVVVPAAALADPAVLATVAATRDMAQAFVDDAARFGITAPLLPSQEDADIARQVVRVTSDFFLDGLDLMARTMGLDVLSVLLLRAVSLANVAHIARNETLGNQYASMDAIPADDLRRPASVYEVGKSLHLPYETARRHMQELVAAGLVDRRDGGFVTPLSVVASPRVTRGVEAFAALTEDLLLGLARAGLRPRT